MSKEKFYDSFGGVHDNALDAQFFSQPVCKKDEEREIGEYSARYNLYELFERYCTDPGYYEAYHGAEDIPEDDERIQAFLNAMQFAAYLV